MVVGKGRCLIALQDLEPDEVLISIPMQDAFSTSEVRHLLVRLVLVLLWCLQSNCNNNTSESDFRFSQSQCQWMQMWSFLGDSQTGNGLKKDLVTEEFLFPESCSIRIIDPMRFTNFVTISTIEDPKLQPKSQITQRPVWGCLALSPGQDLQTVVKWFFSLLVAWILHDTVCQSKRDRLAFIPMLSMTEERYEWLISIELIDHAGRGQRGWSSMECGPDHADTESSILAQ